MVKCHAKICRFVVKPLIVGETGSEQLMAVVVVAADFRLASVMTDNISALV